MNKTVCIHFIHVAQSPRCLVDSTTLRVEEVKYWEFRIHVYVTNVFNTEYRTVSTGR